MYKPELSATMRVGKEWVISSCQCVTCQTNLEVVLQTTVIIMENEVLDYKRPDSLACPRCNSHYIRWDIAKVHHH